MVILAICYVEAVLIGEKSSCESHIHTLIANSRANDYLVFWSWFPIGAAGFKTLLLFISALSVFVLRVGQLHLGKQYQSFSQECY